MFSEEKAAQVAAYLLNKAGEPMPKIKWSTHRHCQSGRVQQKGIQLR